MQENDQKFYSNNYSLNSLWTNPIIKNAQNALKMVLRHKYCDVIIFQQWFLSYDVHSAISTNAPPPMIASVKWVLITAAVNV